MSVPSEWRRYLRLYGSFARICLVREMSFRANFVTRCLASAMWLGFTLAFFRLIYLRTAHIGDWDPDHYLFFLGTGFLLNGLMDALFLENCDNLATSIRRGDLDFVLTKPIDEQFLVSCQRVDWANLPDLCVGAGVLGLAIYRTGEEVAPGRIAGYLVFLLAGLAILYSLMLVMAASSIWTISHRGLYEVWFYVTQFARYPAEIYGGSAAGLALRILLMFVLPVLLAVNVPARYGVRMLDAWEHAAYLLVAAAAALWSSRRFFRFALTRYRSASS